MSLKVSEYVLRHGDKLSPEDRIALLQEEWQRARNYGDMRYGAVVSLQEEILHLNFDLEATRQERDTALRGWE